MQEKTMCTQELYIANSKYLYKARNHNAELICWMCSKLTIHKVAFNWRVIPVSLLLTLSVLSILIWCFNCQILTVVYLGPYQTSMIEVFYENN